MKCQEETKDRAGGQILSDFMYVILFLSILSIIITVTV